MANNTSENQIQEVFFMFQTRVFALLAALLCLFGAAATVQAAEVDCDRIYCFSSGDFSEEELAGICITALPDAETGVVMLGDRVLRPGDILAADQLALMTFAPVRTEEDATATVTYLPIYADRVAPSATMTIGIRGKENQAPIAEDFAAETYKNLPIEGRLKVKDPENETMTFTIVRKPKRGELVINDDGSYLYTPKKNKVGIDSFVYTATDASGKVSRETTVTITIVKPTDSTQYTDTIGKSCRFAAEWMKNTGIFVGEKLDGNACFSPEKEVTRGEFLTMLVKTLDIPMEEDVSVSTYAGEVPAWLQPYLAAAVRSGLVAGLPDSESFGYDQPITEAEAAVMLQNVLDLTAAEETIAVEGAPQWASAALSTLSSYGIQLSSDDTLTRGDAAEALYQASQLAEEAPGMIVIAGQR